RDSIDDRATRGHGIAGQPGPVGGDALRTLRARRWHRRQHRHRWFRRRGRERQRWFRRKRDRRRFWGRNGRGERPGGRRRWWHGGQGEWRQRRHRRQRWHRGLGPRFSRVDGNWNGWGGRTV